MTYTTLKELATELGLDRSNMRKYVLKHGFTPVTIRTNEYQDGRNQAVLALTLEDTEAVRALRATQGFGVTVREPLDNRHGFFYVIQLVPDLDPLRVKLGWTNDVMGRLAAHRTAAPTARLVKSWSCHKSWEVTAIDSVTRIGCSHIGNEVYRCENLEELIIRCNTFFDLMPLV
jgi:hypothetical protein